jgi:uncharacterized protein
MDKERLGVLPFEALQDVARRSGIAFVEEIDRASLIEQILEAAEEDRSDRERLNNIEMLVKEKKFELNPDDNLENKDFLESTLPESYGETRIVFLLRDPEWAFAYWDLAAGHESSVREDHDRAKLHIRVHEIDNDNQYFDIPVRPGDRSRYVNLPKAGCDYYTELIVVVNRNERILCRSNVISSPDSSIESLGAADEMKYVSILSVAGLQEIEEGLGIPHRIISLLDTQYLHLKG